MKLSIIIPYYNAEPYTSELLDVLAPQITDDVEVVLIDDGSKVPFKTDYSWCTVIRQKNGGVSKARNVGIKKSTGEYISFVDSDDLVAGNYVQLILDQIPFDYLEMSWKSLPGEGAQYVQKLNSINDSLPNPSACTRAFRRDFVAGIRFNENKDNAEDEEFTRKVYLNNGRKAVITEYAYFYRTAVEHSNSKKYLNGESNTKRIIYNFRRVTKDMDYLIDEIRKEDEINEVYVMCDICELPELSQYARVIKPCPMRGMELRGEPTSLFTLIETPIKTQVVIYQSNIDRISGLTTFIYDFCKQMHTYYDIMVLYDTCDPIQLSRMREVVDTRQVSRSRQVICDTLLMNSLHDKVPESVTYDNVYQMCHACNIDPSIKLPTDRKVIFVSKAAMKTWGVDKGTYIHNMTAPAGSDKALILVSAMRTGTSEKGQARMIEFAKLLHYYDVTFTWLLFTDMPLKGAVDGMIQMKPTMNIEPYIKAADYVVALSDVEACSYTILEALWDCHTPLIVTPLEMLKEIGFKNGETGYVVPYVISEIDEDLIDQIVHEIPTFTACDENAKNVTKWRKIIGNTKPLGTYEPGKAYKKVLVKMPYYDTLFNRELEPGSVILMPTDRAEEVYRVLGAGYVEIINEN